MSVSIFESSDMLSLFAMPVWVLQLPAGRYEPVNAALLAVVAALRTGATPLAPGTGWQSLPDLHLRPALSGLVDCIHDAVERILAFEKIGHAGFWITGCWANLNATGEARLAAATSVAEACILVFRVSVLLYLRPAGGMKELHDRHQGRGALVRGRGGARRGTDNYEADGRGTAVSGGAPALARKDRGRLG
jgi:hypothetical protein